MSWRGLLLLLLLAAAVACGIAIVKQQRQQQQGGNAEAMTDYVLHDFELVTLKKDGSESFGLRAPKLARTVGVREMNIAQPHFTLPAGDGSHWQAKARHAWVNADGSELRLREEVLLDNTRQDRHPMTLKGQSLTVFPEENRARSDELVTLTQPGFTIRGRGFEALLDENRITLHSEVRARYVPSK